MDRVLADGRTIWREQPPGSDFTALAASRFPERAAELVRDDGLLHMRVATLGRELVSRLASGRVNEALQIAQFLGEVLDSPRCPRELENALQISFVEACEVRAMTSGQELLSLLPPRIAALVGG